MIKLYVYKFMFKIYMHILYNMFYIYVIFVVVGVEAALRRKVTARSQAMKWATVAFNI